VNDDERKQALTEIARWLGSYRTEHAEEDPLLFELFQEPRYLPGLTGTRPCVLVGGRGTGKTTVLRGMSYEGRYFAAGRSLEGFSTWDSIGIYHKIDANRVTAFDGPELDTTTWQRYFGHYTNLILIQAVMTFCAWFEQHAGAPLTPDPAQCRRVGRALGFESPVSSISDLTTGVGDALIDFEVAINNVAAGHRPILSAQGAPLELLIDALLRCPPLQGMQFAFLIDEYENLSDDQQRCFNTLIKSAHSGLTFRIGVKELGWREKSTLKREEFLRDPDDYATVNITAELGRQSNFEEFAHRVVAERLSRMELASPPPSLDPKLLLEPLSEDAEAKLQGVQAIVAARLARLGDRLDATDRALLAELPPLEQYLLFHWADTHPTAGVDEHTTECELIRDRFSESPGVDWHYRYVNYKHTLLYTLVAGRGESQPKLYAGWQTMLELANCNIRYLLELVEDSLSNHVRESRDLGTPVAPRMQTDAARRVGQKNLEELVGERQHGAALVQLVRHLGRVFGNLAREGARHAPELTNFVLSTEGGDAERAELLKLLDAGVRNNAIIRMDGTKLQERSEVRATEYRLHPILSAYFTISWRLKRHLVLLPQILLELSAGEQRAHTAMRRLHKILDLASSSETTDQLSFPEPSDDGRD
jgi:hypothetical protein